MLRLAGQGKRWVDRDETSDEARRILRGGAALDYFRRMVEVQGGDAAQIDDLGKLPQAQIRQQLRAAEDGYIGNIYADKVGLASLALGAGRATKAESIDHAVGIEVHANVGDSVARNDALMTIHANGQDALRGALLLLDGAVAYSDRPVDPLPLFYGVIDGKQV